MTAYHDEDENLSVAKDPRDGPLTAVDRLRLYATDPDTFYFDAEAAEEVVALLDDLDRKTVGEVGVKPLEWSDVLPPDSDCSYTHCDAATPFGLLRIDWKGWKEVLSFSAYLNGEFISVPSSTVEGARIFVEQWWEERIRSALAPSPAIGRETVTDEMVERAMAVQSLRSDRKPNGTDRHWMRQSLKAALGAQP